MNINISLDTEQRNTVLAALRWYQHSGMGDPDRRPNWLQKIACPGPDGGCDTTSLCDEGIDELCKHTLLALATDPGSAPAPIAVLADRARAREALYFVVPSHSPVVTYHHGIQSADDCACRVHGTVYTAKENGGYCEVIDRTTQEISS